MLRALSAYKFNKVDTKMRDLGSSSSASRFPSLRTWVHEGAPFPHTGCQRREVPSLWFGQPLIGGKTHVIVLSPVFASLIIGRLRGEGNYWVYFQCRHLHSLEFRKDFFSFCSKLHVCLCAHVYSWCFCLSVGHNCAKYRQQMLHTLSSVSVPMWCRWSLFLPSSSTNYMLGLCNCYYFTNIYEAYVLSLLEYSQKKSRN